MTWLTLLLLVSDTQLRYGVGIPAQSQSWTDTKYASIAKVTPLSSQWAVKTEVGLLADRYNGGSGILSLGLGPKVTAGKLRIEANWGVTGLTRTDSFQGSHFNFSHDVCGSLYDQVGVGLCWKHISNAGLYTPNQGRDSLQLMWTF